MVKKSHIHNHERVLGDRKDNISVPIVLATLKLLQTQCNRVFDTFGKLTFSEKLTFFGNIGTFLDRGDRTRNKKSVACGRRLRFSSGRGCHGVQISS